MSTIRTTKAELTPKSVVRDLSYLGTKFAQFNSLQDSIAKIFQWENYAKSLLFLVIASFTCFRPIMLLIIPLIYLNVYILIPYYCVPQYTAKYQQEQNQKNPIVLMKSHSTYKESLVDIVLTKLLKPVPQTVTVDPLSADTGVISSGDSAKSGKALYHTPEEVPNSMEFVINMKDLQTMQGKFVNFMRDTEKFLYKNEKLANDKAGAIMTSQILAVLTIVLYFIRTLINWSLLTMIVLWSALFWNHPLSNALKSFFRNPKKLKMVDLGSESETESLVDTDESLELSTSGLDTATTTSADLQPTTLTAESMAEPTTKDLTTATNTPSTGNKFRSFTRNVTKVIRSAYPIEKDWVQVYEIQYKDHANNSWIPAVFTLSPTEIYLNSLENNKQHSIKSVESLDLILPPKNWMYTPESTWQHINGGKEANFMVNWLLDLNIPLSDLDLWKIQKSSNSSNPLEKGFIYFKHNKNMRIRKLYRPIVFIS
ncbi:hypothetical protein ACO0RG_002220 [Hanseniaspora osmophila]